MEMIEERAWLIITLFVRPQRVMRGGRNRGRRGSNEAPRTPAMLAIRSDAAIDSRVLSEFMAFVTGR